MKTVLFAWELGYGLSHSNALLQLARALAARGFRPIFAFANLHHGNDAVAASGFPLLQAPLPAVVVSPTGGTGPGRSFADTLARNGFGDPTILAATVAAWDELLSLAKPDLVVADHAPFAALAAYDAIPVATITTGEISPPGHLAPMSPLEPKGQIHTPEERLMDLVTTLQRSRKRRVPPRLAAVTAGQLQVIRGLPELDAFADLRRGELCGPFEPLAPQAPPPARRRAFAYLHRNYAKLPVTLEAFARMTMPVSVYLYPDAAPIADLIAARGNVEICAAPPPLGSAVADASVVISHGGPGTAAQALAVGRPHLMLPRWPANRQVARLVERGGYGTDLETIDSVLLPSATELAAGDAAMRDRLADIARDIAARGYENFLDRVTERCIELID